MRQTRKHTINTLTIKHVIDIVTHGKGIHPAEEDPLFVVKYGPPGSGKSSSKIYKEIEKLGPPLSSFVDINQDTLVESLKDYQNNHTQYNRLRYQKNRRGLSLYKKSSIVLQKAVNVRANIIIEITGGQEDEKKGPLGWIYKLLKGTPYKIVVMMPTVPLETSLKRLETRSRTRNAEEVKKEYKHSLDNFEKFIKPNHDVIIVDNA